MAVIALCLASTGATWAATKEVVNPAISRAQAIGIEGRAVVALPAADYQIKPLDDRTELILRIEQIERSAGQNRYHFHFIGLEPGAYRIADYLVRPDGSRPDEIGDARLEVRALLPEEHDGKLNSFVARPFPFIGGYRGALAALAVVWVAGLAGFRIMGRKKVVPTAVEVVRSPTFAERLRPLVEAAARGQLTVEEQATLERLLMGYWRDKLALDEARMADTVVRLKAHGEAGAILRAVERWLHQAGGGDAGAEINSLLEPYRTGRYSYSAASEGSRA
jgi:hypothetical protein